MGLKNDKIQKEDILAQYSEYDLFRYYFGDFSLGKCYPSKFRTDNNPSTGFYINRKNTLIYNDISTGEKLDVFAFVGRLYGLDYYKAIKRVAKDLNITFDGVKREKIVVEHEIKKPKVIEITYRDWDVDSLGYWKQYGITKEELEENDVYNVNKLFVDGTIRPNFIGELQFAYTIDHLGKVYKKIYQPYSKEFKWLSSIPIYIPFGANKLPYESDVLVVNKSAKERILTLKYHSDVIGIQNESMSALRDNTLTYLKKKYKRIVCIFDNDTAGLKACADYKERGCETYHLPLTLAEKGIKDTADLVNYYDLNTLEKWLKTII